MNLKLLISCYLKIYEHLKKIDSVDSISKFYLNFDSIFKVVKSRMMGMPPDPKLEEKLTNMKERVSNEIDFDEDFERKINVLIDFSNGKYHNQFNNRILIAMVEKKKIENS